MEPRTEGERAVREMTLDIMRRIDGECVQRVLDVAEDVRARVTGTADQYAESPALTLEHLVEPMLEALGFGAEHRLVEPHRPNVYHLSAMGSPVALLVANALGSTYAQNPNLTNRDARYRFVREDTGFQSRIVFTNGLSWVVFDGDPEVPPYQFSIDQTDAFWDLFFLVSANRLGPLGGSA